MSYSYQLFDIHQCIFPNLIHQQQFHCKKESNVKFKSQHNGDSLVSELNANESTIVNRSDIYFSQF